MNQQNDVDTSFTKKRYIDNNPVIAQVYDDNKTRFRVVCSGRQVGKTTLAVEELIKVAISKPNSVSYAVAPTNKMAHALFHDKIYQRLLSLNIKFTYKKSLKIFTLQYPNNKSTIILTGVDDPDKLRGLTLDFVAIDEYDYMERRVWFEIFRPALSIKKGRALFTSTPKGLGQIKELYEYGQNKDEKFREYKSWLFKSIESPFMPKTEIELAKATMDIRLFRQEFEGSFETNANKVAYNFDRTLHIHEIPFIPNREICIGCDFNILMCWTAFQIVSKEDLKNLGLKFNEDKYSLQDEIVVFLKEWKTPNCSTPIQCDLVKQWLEQINYKGDVNFYGDSSGNARDTGQNVDIHSHKFNTDWNIIKDEFEHGYCYYDKANPIIKNRINSLNAKLLNADNQIGVLINPTLPELIKDLENVSWTDEGKFDKSKERKLGIGHLFDAATYPIYYEFDLNRRVPTIMVF